MAGTDDTAMLRELIDREKIRDCLYRYCHGADRSDREMISSSIWPDAKLCIGDYDGDGAGFADWVIPRLNRIPVTQHFMGNMLIRIEGNEAKCETYARNWHTFRNAAGRLHDVIQGKRYLDRFEKRGEEWRVIDRYCTFEWILENPVTIDFSAGALGQDSAPSGKRGHADPVYTFLGGLGTEGCLTSTSAGSPAHV